MRLLLPIAFAFFVIACSPPPPPTGTGPGEVDAGNSSPDSGVELDAGTVSDAGSEVDAGSPMDAGEPMDAGTPLDAGVDAGCMCTSSQYCSAGTCVADTVAPRVTVAASAGTSPATLHVTGTASDGETGLASVELRLNGMSAVTVSVVAGLYDAQVPVPAGRAEYTVVATARDVANNSATAQTTFDGAAPAVVLTPSQDGACSSTGCTGAFIDAAATSFALSAAVTEGMSLAASHPVQVRVLNGATEVVAWTDLTLQPNGSWSWTWSSLPALDFTQLTLEVAATDAGNNRGTASLGVLLDRVRPSLSIAPAANASCTATACTGTIVNAASTSLDLTGLVSADATLSLRVLDGAAVVVAPVAVPQTGGVWSYAWTTFPNVDGRFYALEVTATDALMNSVSRQLVVLVDRVNPGVVVNTPRQGTLVGTAQVTVNATATDGLGLKAVELATSPSGPFVSATRDANGDYVGQLPVPTVDAVEQVLTVRATDLADNVRVTTARYTADRVAPVVTIGGTDFDCNAAGPCTGSVANAASTQVVYGGTFSDGSAVTLQKTIIGPSGSVIASTDAVTGSTWSWTWSNLPAGVNGAGFVLHVIATDAAGNSAADVRRFTWLDNVAPTVTFPVAGQRNVASDAVLEVFSERMDMFSVNTATSLTPSVVNRSFAAPDSIHFQFPPLAPYTPYTLTVGPAADKAGNLSATASASFLTAPMSRSFPIVFGLSSARAPRIAVDDDGRFTVAAAVVSGSGSTTVVMSDLGINATATFTPQATSATLQVPSDLRVVGSSRGADLRLTTQLELVRVTSGGSGSALESGLISIGWSGSQPSITSALPSAIGATSTMTPSTLTSNRPMMERIPFYDPLSRTSGTYRSIVAPNNGATAMFTWNEQPGWASMSTATLTACSTCTPLLNGRASVEPLATLGQYRLRYWDFGAMSEVITTSWIRSATAQPSFKATDRLGSLVATSSSYVAWTSDSDLSVGCRAIGSSVWQTATATMPAGRTTGSPLGSAMTPSTFAVAGEYGGNVYVYSTPLTACGAPPVLTQVGRIDGASEPAVAIDSTGRIWVAWIHPNGQVGVSRF